MRLLGCGAYARPRFALYDREKGEPVPAAYSEARALLDVSARYQDLAARATLATLIGTGQSGTSQGTNSFRTE